jgi:osmotically inducible lipoprotein OsmB
MSLARKTFDWRDFMNTTRTLALVPVLLLSAALAGCGSMSHRDKTTAAGAAIGGVAGSVLTDGSVAGTVGGAAVGGVIGNQVGKKKER